MCYLHQTDHVIRVSFVILPQVIFCFMAQVPPAVSKQTSHFFAWKLGQWFIKVYLEQPISLVHYTACCVL